MAARSIASLTLSFGLVSIPVRLYSATQSGSEVKFNLLSKDGSRLKQQYVSAKDAHVVPREEMVKGYEFDNDQFVLFTADELKKLEEGSSHVIAIIAFIPDEAVDPVYYDKPYLLAPDKRGAKPYNLLMAAMQQSGRSALAKWSWKTKQYVVQVRATPDGLVLHQLRYADEVRTLKELDIEKVPVSDNELQLATQLIDQITTDTYDPEQYEDEEKKRVLAAIDEKIAGKEIVAIVPPEEGVVSGQVIDLMEALRASLRKQPASDDKPKRAAGSNVSALPDAKSRKAAKRARSEPAPTAPSPRRARAKK